MGVPYSVFDCLYNFQKISRHVEFNMIFWFNYVHFLIICIQTFMKFQILIILAQPFTHTILIHDAKMQ